jgi:hypothetical protein
MLIVRKKQFDVLAELSRQSFEDRLAEHLSQVVPAESGEAGEEGVRELIRSGMNRAGDYDIVNEIDIAHFVELMLRFEPEWEFAPHRKWALDILRDEDLTGHLGRAIFFL